MSFLLSNVVPPHMDLIRLTMNISRAKIERDTTVLSEKELFSMLDAYLQKTWEGA